jgi:hypothetical protein
MSSINLERFRNRHPTERDALTRLEPLLSGPTTRRVTLDQLADMIAANSRDELALVLGELAANGLIDLHWQIRSPITRQPVARFKEVAEIPRMLHDVTTDTDFEVNLDDARAIYLMPRSPAEHDHD